jgi:hypothetical protein
MDTATLTLISSALAALGAIVASVAAPYYGYRSNTELAALRVALATAEATAARREAKIDALKAALAEERKP